MKNRLAFLGLILFSSALFSQSPYVPGQALIITRSALPGVSEISSSSAISLVRSTGLSAQSQSIITHYQLKTIRPIGSTPEKRHALTSFRSTSTSSLGYTYVLEFENTALDAEALSIALKQDPSIIAAQPNYILQAQGHPSLQTTNTIRSASTFSWHVADTKLLDAWAISSGNRNTVIAVIDTGVTRDHPDLSDATWINVHDSVDGSDSDNNGFIDDYWGWDFVDEDNNPMGTSSSNGNHGTHVAGIVAGKVNESSGTAGACPNCAVMAIRSGNSNGFSIANIVSGLDYAVDNGAHIINMSFGGEIPLSDVLDAHLQAAADAGVMLIAAAGNNSTNMDSTPFYPASHPDVIAISALKSGPAFASFFSNYGSAISVSAPGQSIKSTVYSGSAYTYETWDGTSMASPFAAGVAGLIKSVYPNMNRFEIQELMESTALDLGSTGKDDYYGYGMVDPHAAISESLVDTTPPVIAHSPISSILLNASANIWATITDNISAWTGISATVNYRLMMQSTPVGNWVSLPMLHVSGNLFSAIISPPSGNSSHISYYIQASDATGNESVLPVSDSFSITLLEITPPELSFGSLIENDYFSAEQLLTIQLTDDNDLDLDSISLEIRDGASVQSTAIQPAAVQVLTLGSAELSYVSPNLILNVGALNLEPGPVQITVSASDQFGNAMTPASIIVQLAGDSFELFGPEGAGSRVINAPNPFNPDKELTYISYQNTQTADVSIKLYDLYGHKIRTWDRRDNAGFHEVPWDGRDDGNNTVPNGVYIAFIRAEASGKTVTKRLKIAVLR